MRQQGAQSQAGTVLIDGGDYTELTRREIAGNIGVIFQNSVASFPFTVLDRVIIGRIPAMERFERESENDLDVVKKTMEMTTVVSLTDSAMNQISGEGEAAHHHREGSDPKAEDPLAG